MEPLAVDCKKAAELTGLSIFTIRDKVRRGELPAIHVGRRILVSLDQLRGFLERHSRRSDGAPPRS